MRFIAMHRATPEMEAGLPPPPDLVSSMGALTQAMSAAGVFEAGEGLRASAYGMRLRYTGGQCHAIHGPLTPANELPAVLVLARGRDIEAMLTWAGRLAHIYGDVEIDVRPVCEAWHYGYAPPPPPDTPVRYLLQVKADARAETGMPLSPAQRVAFQALQAEMRQAGALMAVEEIAPSSQGLRLMYKGRGAPRVIDGPFTESKELIAGFCIMRVDNRAMARAWTDRFAAHFDAIEVDLRPLAEGGIQVLFDQQ